MVFRSLLFLVYRIRYSIFAKSGVNYRLVISNYTLTDSIPLQTDADGDIHSDHGQAAGGRRHNSDNGIRLPADSEWVCTKNVTDDFQGSLSNNLETLQGVIGCSLILLDKGFRFQVPKYFRKSLRCKQLSFHTEGLRFGF